MPLHSMLLRVCCSATLVSNILFLYFNLRIYFIIISAIISSFLTCHTHCQYYKKNVFFYIVSVFISFLFTCIITSLLYYFTCSLIFNT